MVRKLSVLPSGLLFWAYSCEQLGTNCCWNSNTEQSEASIELTVHQSKQSSMDYAHAKQNIQP